eukprot:329107-Chlamydomonas_euryale.AAC.21
MPTSWCDRSAFSQAALDHSITMKRVEAGLTNLSYWGKVTTLNGKVRAANGCLNPHDRAGCWQHRTA